jgi:hypothetical protein
MHKERSTHDNLKAYVPAVHLPGGVTNLAPSRPDGSCRGAATVPAPALSAVIGRLPTSLDADADLLALTVSFDPLFDAWRNMFVQQDADLEELNEHLRRKTGRSRAEADRLARDSPELAAYREILMNECEGRERHHYDPDAWEPVSDRFYAVAEEILSYRASTRQGLALQVRAFISSYSEIWEDDDGGVRAFVECVCDFAGVPFPPVPEEAQSAAATVRRPSEPDPISAAIAEHRQAVKAEARALEDTFGFGGGPADEPEDSPAHVAAEERHSTASDRTQATVWKLVEIEPTTAAGLRALMQYVVAIEPGLQWPPGWEREFHKACLRSTEALIDGVRT